MRLGIQKEDLPKYVEELKKDALEAMETQEAAVRKRFQFYCFLELKISKAQLEELKKDALEAMETQKKREEFKDEAMPDVKSLDVRNFI